MTRDAIADRLVSYGDAIVAVVNSLAFPIALTERDVRCSFADIQFAFWISYLAFFALLTGALVGCRQAELRLRSGSSDQDRDAAVFDVADRSAASQGVAVEPGSRCSTPTRRGSGVYWREEVGGGSPSRWRFCCATRPRSTCAQGSRCRNGLPLWRRLRAPALTVSDAARG